MSIHSKFPCDRSKLPENILRCIIISCLILLSHAVPVLAGSAPGTGMVGSIHDMTLFNYVFQDPQQRVCILCHTPHNANPSAGALWSLNLDPATITITPYKWTAPPNQGISFNSDPLVGPSRLCLTCHDGNVAIDTAGDTIQSAYPQDVISTNLCVTHPIGFSYDDAFNTRGIKELANKNSYLATAITISNVPGVHNQITRNSSLRISDILYEGSIVTCMTCHDIHNDQNVTPDPGHTYNYLLWAKEEGSLNCLSCHIK